MNIQRSSAPIDARAKKEERTTALLRLARSIASGRKTFRALLEVVSEERPIGERTLFRYLDALRKLGYPIEIDDQKRYHFAAGFSPAQLALPNEALSAIATIRCFANILGPQVGDALDRLIPEMEHAQSAYILPVDPVSHAPELQATLALLERARAQRQVVRFTYADREEKQSLREAEIYSFVVSNGRVYAKTRDVRKNAPRSFAVDSMSEVELIPRIYTPLPGYAESTSGAHSFSGLYDGPTFDVRVRFRRHVAKSARRSRLAQHAEPLELLDGGVELVLRVVSADELIGWVMGFGGDAEVIAPDTIRTGIAERAATLAQIHQTLT